MKPMKYSTKFAMVQCRSGYSGVDTMNISTHSDFSTTSDLLSRHEDASIIGRNDIRLLLNQKVANKQISSELAHSFIRNAKKRFHIEELRQFAQGSTYVSFIDMITIHLFESSDKQEVKVLKDTPNRQVEHISVKRSWPILINILQTEDNMGYGSQFRSIPSFNILHIPSLVTWTLFSLISSCKALWKAIDLKSTPFKYSGWEGWILTTIHSMCFQFHTISTDKRSPFKKIYSLSDIATKVNNFINPDLFDENRNDGNAFYKFDKTCFNLLFDENDYQTNILIVESVDEFHIHHNSIPKIILAIGKDAPTNGMIIIDNIQFELRVICHIKSHRKGRHQSDFNAIRYMRHGDGYDSWWQQERNTSISPQETGGEDMYNIFRRTPNHLYFSQFVCAYAKTEDSDVDEWKNIF